MIALPSNRSPWLTAPSGVRWLAPPRRPAVAMYARSIGVLAVATAVGFALMGTAPRADQTKIVEAAVEQPAVMVATRLPAAAGDRRRAPVESRRVDPLSSASLFAAAPITRRVTFSSGPLAGPSPEGFVPRSTNAAQTWREEEFPSVTVVDGRTLLAGAVRIRLVGLDLPMPEQVCRTLDGRLELCTTRAATQLELLTRWRRVTCHYRLESAEEAIGRCRIGTSDLTERMVKTGYTWRSAPPA